MSSLVVKVRIEPRRQGDFTLDVGFEARPGITILFGPSGSGKSTTLRAVAGLVRPDAGRVTIGDRVWFDSAARVDTPVEWRGLAYVFQSLALFPHMSVQHNVEYGVDRALPAAERARLARATLERMKVAHLAARRPPTLSGGEAQRVALARAFARSPSAVLLDEPFSALDRDLKHDLIGDVVTTVHDLGIPAILVTHHRNEARAMGDRVVLLEAGHVTAEGSLEELLPDLDLTSPGGPRRGRMDALDRTPMPRHKPKP